jgi:hypothetical protein
MRRVHDLLVKIHELERQSSFLHEQVMDKEKFNEGEQFTKQLNKIIDTNDIKKFLDACMNMHDDLKAQGIDAFNIKVYLKNIIDDKL